MKTITCACGATFDAAVAAPGARVRCPKCKKLVPIPAVGATRGHSDAGVHRVKHGRGKGGNRGVLIGSAAGLLAAVGLVFVLKDGAPPEPTPEDRGKKGFQQIVDDIQPKDAKGWMAVARACRENGLKKEFEESVEKALKLAPGDEEIASEYASIVRGWVEALDREQRDYADQLFAIGERVEAAGLKKLAMDLYEQIAGDGLGKRLSKIPGIAPKHPKANKKLGRVLTDYGTYEAEDLWNDIKGKLADMSKRDAILNSLPPWNRKAYLKKEDIEKRIGGKMKFKVVDQKPYLVAVQDSNQYSPELLAEDYRRVVEELYRLFQAEYSKKFGLEKVFETDDTAEVLPIIVYDSWETYREQNPDMPDWAGGHFNTLTGDIEVYRKHGDLNYETIFHEGAHQLVGAATKALGAKHTNTHWLSEGIACYFGAFRRDERFQIRLGAVNDEYLGTIRRFARKGKHLPFEKFVARMYGEFVLEQSQLDPFSQQLFVDLSYAQAWAFVYFLRNYENGKYRDKFDEYFKEELHGRGSIEVFTKIFGDVKTIEKEFLTYINALKPGG